MTTPEKESIFKGRAAFVLGATLLVGFAGLAALTALDRKDRTALEMLEEPTAAGVPATEVPPESKPGVNSSALLTLKGKLYYGEDIVRHSDGTMVKAGTDDSGAIPIYQRMRRDQRKRELYVKIAPGRFMEIDVREDPTDQKEEAAPAEAAPAAPSTTAS